MLKRNTSIRNDENKWGELFSMLLTQEQLSLSANKVFKLVCTVIRTVGFYA